VLADAIAEITHYERPRFHAHLSMRTCGRGCTLRRHRALDLRGRSQAVWQDRRQGGGWATCFVAVGSVVMGVARTSGTCRVGRAAFKQRR